MSEGNQIFDGPGFADFDEHDVADTWASMGHGPMTCGECGCPMEDTTESGSCAACDAAFAQKQFASGTPSDSSGGETSAKRIHHAAPSAGSSFIPLCEAWENYHASGDSETQSPEPVGMIEVLALLTRRFSPR